MERELRIYYPQEGKTIVRQQLGNLSHLQCHSCLYQCYQEWRNKGVRIELKIRPSVAPRLALFDLDGTLIEGEYMRELAPLTTDPSKMKVATQQALDGDANWEESFRQRVALLAGISVEQALAVAKGMQLAPDMQQWIKDLQAAGCEVGMLTGAYHRLAHLIAAELGIKLVLASHLEEQAGYLTGKIIGEPLTPYHKALTLVRLAEERQLQLTQVLAVGDSVADLPMLSLAGQSLLCT